MRIMHVTSMLTVQVCRLFFVRICPGCSLRLHVSMMLDFASAQDARMRSSLGGSCMFLGWPVCHVAGGAHRAHVWDAHRL
jgi:hypothetical protein